MRACQGSFGRFSDLNRLGLNPSRRYSKLYYMTRRRLSPALLLAAGAVAAFAAACSGGDGKISFLQQATATPEETARPQVAWQQAQLDSDPRLPGIYVKPHPGPDGVLGTSDDRGHVANSVVIPICTADQIARDQIATCYNSNPPTSGLHGASPMPFAVLDNPAPKENLVHNMEHGGVVIWYNTNDPEIIRQLASITNDALAARRLVVMTPYSGMESNTIALTAWTRLDKFPVSQFNRKRVEDFIAKHDRRFNPEGF
jgi:hypothetical protein